MHLVDPDAQKKSQFAFLNLRNFNFNSDQIITLANSSQCDWTEHQFNLILSIQRAIS